MGIRRITTRDIAKHLDLHYTTVAEALRNSRRISKETRKRVSEAAQELGYRPDPILSALNAYRSAGKSDRRGAAIAWINSYSDANAEESKVGFYSDCLRGARNRADELGYTLENFWLQNPRMSGRRATGILVARGIRCVLVPALDETVKSLDLEWEKFSAVRLGHSLRGSNLTSVSPDQMGNTMTLFRFLVRNGFRRIGFACPQWINQRVNSGFAAGFLGAHQDCLPTTAPAPLFQKDLEGSAKTEFIAWIRAHKFEALMLHRHYDYESVIREAGIRVPEELSLAWISLLKRSSHRCGIFENGDIVGRDGIDQVAAMLNRGEYGPVDPQKDLRVYGTLIPGTTVKISAAARGR